MDTKSLLDPTARTLLRNARLNPYERTVRAVLADRFDELDDPLRAHVWRHGVPPGGTRSNEGPAMPTFIAPSGEPFHLEGNWNSETLSDTPLAVHETPVERWELWHALRPGAVGTSGHVVKYTFKHPGRSNTIEGAVPHWVGGRLVRPRKDRYTELVAPLTDGQRKELFPGYSSLADRQAEPARMARPGDTTGAAFERAIVENPLESAHHLAYADYLGETGDPDEAAFRQSVGEWLQKGPNVHQPITPIPHSGHRNPSMLKIKLPWVVPEGALPAGVKAEDVERWNPNGATTHTEFLRRSRFRTNGTGYFPADPTHAAGDYPNLLRWETYPHMEAALRKAFVKGRAKSGPVKLQLRANGLTVSGGLAFKSGQFLGRVFHKIRDVARKLAAKGDDEPARLARESVPTRWETILSAGQNPDQLGRPITVGELAAIERRYGVPLRDSVTAKLLARRVPLALDDNLRLPLKSITALVDRLARHSLKGHRLSAALRNPAVKTPEKLQYLTDHLVQQFLDYRARHGETDWYGEPVRELEGTLGRLIGPGKHRADMFKALIALTSSSANPVDNVGHAWRIWSDGASRGDPILAAHHTNVPALAAWLARAGPTVPATVGGDKSDPHPMGKWYYKHIHGFPISQEPPGYSTMPAILYANRDDPSDPANGMVYARITRDKEKLVFDKSLGAHHDRLIGPVDLPNPENGQLSPKGWTIQKQQVAGNLKRLQALVRLGYKRFDKTAMSPGQKQEAAYKFASGWLTTPHDEASWGRMRKALKNGIQDWHTVKKVSFLLPHEGMPGAFIFGPKQGPFLLNLHGQHQWLTADKWWTRWWNLPQSHSARMAPRGAGERRAMRAVAEGAVKQLATEHGIHTTPSGFQADLWDQAQKAYQNLGGEGMDSYTMADGARALAARVRPVEQPAKLARRFGPEPVPGLYGAVHQEVERAAKAGHAPDRTPLLALADAFDEADDPRADVLRRAETPRFFGPSRWRAIAERLGVKPSSPVGPQYPDLARRIWKHIGVPMPMGPNYPPRPAVGYPAPGHYVVAGRSMFRPPPADDQGYMYHGRWPRGGRTTVDRHVSPDNVPLYHVTTTLPGGLHGHDVHVVFTAPEYDDWVGSMEPEQRPKVRPLPERAPLRLARSLAYVSPSTETGLSAKQAAGQFRSLPDLPSARKALGVWSGGAEPAYVLSGADAADRALRLGADWHQHSVLSFAEGPGDDKAHMILVPSKNAEAIHAQALKHGVEYKTLIPTPRGTLVHVIDQGNELAPQIDAWAREAGAIGHKILTGMATLTRLSGGPVKLARPGDTTGEAFEKAIAENPDEDTHWLAYADYLDETGGDSKKIRWWVEARRTLDRVLKSSGPIDAHIGRYGNGVYREYKSHPDWVQRLIAAHTVRRLVGGPLEKYVHAAERHALGLLDDTGLSRYEAEAEGQQTDRTVLPEMRYAATTLVIPIERFKIVRDLPAVAAASYHARNIPENVPASETTGMRYALSAPRVLARYSKKVPPPE